MRWKAWIVASSLCVPYIAQRSVAFAQHAPDGAARARARQNFQTGVAAFQRGDFSVALEAFLTAYRLAPHPTVRVNIANCYMQLHQPIEALSYFELFLTESPNAAPEQRSDVQHQIDELRGQVAEYHVALSPDGLADATVTIDGHSASVRESVRLMPGHHVVEVAAPGYQPERTELNATAGLRTDVVMRMRPIAGTSNTAVAVNTTGTAPPVGASVEPASTAPSTTTTTDTAASAATTTTASASANTSNDVIDTRPHDHHTLPPAYFYTGVAVTGVGLVTFATCGILALVNNGTYENARSNIQSGNYMDLAAEQARGHNALVATNTFKVVTDISLGVTVAAAAATVFLFTRTRFDNRPAVAVSPFGGAGTGGLVVTGAF